MATRLSTTARNAACDAVVDLLDGVNYSVNNLDATMVLIEESGSAGDYFDGSSLGASWDGTAGLSASTLNDTTPNTGTSSVSLPPLDSAVSGTATTSGQSTAVLPELASAAFGTAKTTGTSAADLPGLNAAATGTAKTTGLHAATLPTLGTASTGTAKTVGASDLVLPRLDFAAAGAATTAGHMDITLPALVAGADTPSFLVLFLDVSRVGGHSLRAGRPGVGPVRRLRAFGGNGRLHRYSSQFALI
ncbi:hypothetical protein ACQPYK_29585 [Streptosporangium sp. CA-135522]|uniref:hypothetical protein n=1 Tax=Streptosporangium sp. CA-135522 TaxID=3240072 RepID=UPI003D924E9D